MDKAKREFNQRKNKKLMKAMGGRYSMPWRRHRLEVTRRVNKKLELAQLIKSKKQVKKISLVENLIR